MKDIKIFSLGIIFTLTIIAVLGITTAATIMNAGGNEIINLNTGTGTNNAATKGYVDAAGGSPADWSCTLRTNSCSTSSSCTTTVSCSGSEKVITGGCYSQGDITSSSPSGQGWRCAVSSGGFVLSVTAYANCCS